MQPSDFMSDHRNPARPEQVSRTAPVVTADASTACIQAAFPHGLRRVEERRRVHPSSGLGQPFLLRSVPRGSLATAHT